MSPTDPPAPEENPLDQAEDAVRLPTAEEPAEGLDREPMQDDQAEAIRQVPLRANITGQPVVIQGQTWLLADAGLAPELTELRDQLYDMSVIKGTANLVECMGCAFLMLTANYRISPEDARALLWQADPDDLVDAVFGSLFGPDNIRRTYTAWARSALLANGIKPSSIPPAELPHVLKQLVGTKRAIPIEDFTEADEAMAARTRLLNYDRN